MKRITKLTVSVEKTGPAPTSPTPPPGPWRVSLLVVQLAVALVGVARIALPHLTS